MKPTKQDKQLTRIAKQLGIEVHGDTKRKKGESLLSWRMRDWCIPECTSYPIANQVIVWRLPPLKLSVGGLVVPEDANSPNCKGVIMAMGPVAADLLVGNGIDVGHIVIFSRFAGWELHDNTATHARSNQILFLKGPDILASDDVNDMMKSGAMRVVKGEDGKHRFAKVSDFKALPPVTTRKQKLEAMAERGGTQVERETAARLAAKTK